MTVTVYNKHLLKFTHYCYGFSGVSNFGFRFLKHFVSPDLTFFVPSPLILIFTLFHSTPGIVNASLLY